MFGNKWRDRRIEVLEEEVRKLKDRWLEPGNLRSCLWPHHTDARELIERIEALQQGLYAHVAATGHVVETQLAKIVVRKPR